MEYIYLDYLNKSFIETFENEHQDYNIYAPYLYAGMLFNISMAWLDNDCNESIDKLSETIINAIL